MLKIKVKPTEFNIYNRKTTILCSFTQILFLSPSERIGWAMLIHNACYSPEHEDILK